MTGIPVTYRKGTNTDLQYDFINQATGVGYLTLYCGDVSGAEVVGQDQTAQYIMSPNQFYSSIGSTGAVNQQLDLRFNMNINRPMIIEGEAISTIPFLFHNEEAGTEDRALTAVTELFYIRNGVTTSITSGSGTARFIVGTTKAENEVACVKMTCPRTYLLAGDVLRLYVWNSGAGWPAANKKVSIGHDPMNRFTIERDPWQTASTTGTWDQCSQLTLNLPLVIDL